jgi:hypothetical protein
MMAFISLQPRRECRGCAWSPEVVANLGQALVALACCEGIPGRNGFDRRARSIYQNVTHDIALQAD